MEERDLKAHNEQLQNEAKNVNEDVLKLTNDIIKYFPMFFADYKNWQFGNGRDAGKEFKRILNRAKKINKSLTCQ